MFICSHSLAALLVGEEANFATTIARVSALTLNEQERSCIVHEIIFHRATALIDARH